jgi:hypothetical protein
MDPAEHRVDETAGVIARPPLLFVAALLLGFLSDRLLPLPFPVPRIDPIHWIIAGFPIVIGLVLAAAGICDFSRGATPVPTNQPTRALVTTACTAGPASHLSRHVSRLGRHRRRRTKPVDPDPPLPLAITI